MTMQRLWPHFSQLSGGFFGGYSSDVYDPVWLRCLDLVLETLQDMAAGAELEEIASASIVGAEQPYLKPFFGTAAEGGQALAYPGIIVWPFQQEGYDPAAASNNRDEIVYSVAVSFVDKGSGKTGTNAMITDRDAWRRHMLWRERVSRRFRFATWPTITEIQKSNVRYQLYALPEQYRSNDIFHGAVVIDFTAWETRDDGT
jgi:hypothetical protein